jgi:aryl-alcohol dehydrogenase-like predicted oxidoreductase/predicted kinase
MRLSTDESRDEELATETIAAAAEAGITVFDTARAYGHGEGDLGHNERLLATALRRCGGDARARVVTKGGMARTGGAWVADGRAKAIARDCQASLVALGGLPIDLYLLHAPDLRTPWGTSVRALARLVDEGMVRRVGLSNVNRGQLDEALALVPVAAVEVALSAYDERALRGGVLERCAELGIAVLAHSPLGGPRRAGSLRRRAPWSEVAQARGVAPAEVALAWLLELSPTVIAIPGARRPATARSAAHAATLTFDAEERALLGRALAAVPQARREAPRPDGHGGDDDDANAHHEVVLVMGIPGAGKSRVAADYVARGYLRLNRDERGGGLRELADALDAELSAGARRIVLDNTYLSRAARSYVIEAAARHGILARCVWLSTPLAQAQVNLVERLLERFGGLPSPDELRGLARSTPGVLTPTSQMRALRELEPPAGDEGFAGIEVVPFSRSSAAGARAGVYVAAAAMRAPRWEQALEGVGDDPRASYLLFDWIPDGAPDALEPEVARLAGAVSGPVERALCPHGAGPPSCWCRPPLPGLALAFARAHAVDPSRSVLIGCGPAHRTLAVTLGARYVAV